MDEKRTYLKLAAISLMLGIACLYLASVYDIRILAIAAGFAFCMALFGAVLGILLPEDEA